MKLTSAYLGLVSGILTSGIFLPAMAQVTSDGTTNTIVNPNGNNFTIISGIDKGNNLFHSFSNFSVPVGGAATFDLTNTPNITTIFSRVTGRNVSEINGLIRTLNSNSPVNLFLMNPYGIVFGKDASLNIGGSFVGTTANSIKFADGVEFSAANTAITPLLTISVPVGLQMGANPGPITIQGTGHRMQFTSRFAPIVGAGQQSTGLLVSPNSTFALIGGKVDLNGGVVSAPSGRIELGSVANGSVSLNSTSKGWAFGYENIQNFDDVRLSRLSALDASGLGNANLQLVGRNISLNQGSIAIIRNQAATPGGNIQVIASESLELAGTAANGLGGSLLFSDAVAGSSADIKIASPQIRLRDTGIIASRAFSNATGGNLAVNAKDIQVDGQIDHSTTNRTGISAISTGKGNIGATSLSTQSLTILNGGFVGASTSGTGNGGTFTVNSNTITVDGNGLQPSILTSGTLGSGNAGQLTVNTNKLTVTNGGALSTTTLARGKAGNLTINATESITIAGQAKRNNSFSASNIGSDANIIPSPATRRALGIPDMPSGASGNVTITTQNLQVTDGGEIRVNNDGLGNGGEMSINTKLLYLNNGGKITAATEKGEGGNISLEAQNILLRNQSAITATAGEAGNGGDINITSPTIVGLENSDIIANAVKGRGGNIFISTEGIFGLKYRNQLTGENDITASSEFGVNGTVDINNFGVNPNSGLIELPVELIDPSQQIGSRCADTSGSSFIATGRGGVPQNPTQEVRSDRTWSDIRDISAYRKTNTVTVTTPAPAPTASEKASENLIQATGWRRNAQGKVELVADNSSAQAQPALSCTVVSIP